MNNMTIISTGELDVINFSASADKFLKYPGWFAMQHKLLDFPKQLM